MPKPTIKGLYNLIYFSNVVQMYNNLHFNRINKQLARETFNRFV